MEIAKIVVSGTSANVIQHRPIPSGLVGATISVEYIADIWNGLSKTVVFQGCTTRDVVTNDRTIVIPHEVLSKPNRMLSVGFYGMNSSGDLIVPTFYANLGLIKPGTDPSGDPSTKPELPIWAQLANELAALRKDLDEIPVSGGALSPQAVALLLTILGEAMYSTDQTENIEKLREALGAGGEDDPEIPDEPDKPGEPEEPDIPDIPVTPKLSAPVIRLETVGEPSEPDEPEEPEEPEEPDGNTPAILGVAILGRTILGSYKSNMPKLNAPVIRLVSAQKLDAPVIRLEADMTPDAPDEPEGPEEPEIPKLSTPNIRLVTVSSGTVPDDGDPPMGGVTTSKLSPPVIYLEECDHSWNDGAVTKAPTEQETGILTYTCTKCGDTRTEAIPVLDHVHSYVATVTNPTCTDRGYTTHTCTCGDSYVNSCTDALGHDWSTPYYASVFATGYGRKCSRCGALEVMDVPMVKLGTPVIRLMDTKLKTPVIDIHDYSSVVVEPTCTAKGYTLNSCACGDRYVDNFVDALGHDWGYPYKSGDEYVRDCARCGEQETGAEQYLKGRIRLSVESSGDASFVDGQIFAVIVTPPDGFKQTSRLTTQYPELNFINVPLGQYTIEAKDGYGAIDGYNLTVKYTVQHGNADPVETQTFVLTPEECDPVVKIIYHYEKITEV